jgi:DNA processing protein
VAALVALVRTGARPAPIYSELVEEGVSAEEILAQEQGLLAAQLLEAARSELAGWQARGIRLTTVLDADYPENLRAAHDRPPLLFIAGRLAPGDGRAVAVIGSRRASRTGLARAGAIAKSLVEAGYTVVSGLASGIDAAAHTAALARGGRTLAVLGTGLDHSYPPENAALQQEIARDGCVISQFWPEVRPARENFPLRNALMSGISLATVVVEATHTSGTRTQIRAALKHGRPVLLARPVAEQAWARDLLERWPIHVIGSPQELLEVVVRLSATDRPLR